MVLKDFCTLDTLSSFPGMVTVISILTQSTKKLFDRFLPNRTGYIVYFYSLFLVFFVSYAKEELSGDTRKIIIQIVINILNTIVVALASMKAYETILSKVDYTSYTKKILKKEM